MIRPPAVAPRGRIIDDVGSLGKGPMNAISKLLGGRRAFGRPRRPAARRLTMGAQHSRGGLVDDGPFIQRSDGGEPVSPDRDGSVAGRTDLRRVARYLAIAAAVCLLLGLLAVWGAHASLVGYLDTVDTAPGGGWLLLFLPATVGFSGSLVVIALALATGAVVLLVIAGVMLVVGLVRRRSSEGGRDVRPED